MSADIGGPEVVAHSGSHPSGLKVIWAVFFWTAVPCMVTVAGGEVSAPVHISKHGGTKHPPALRSRSLMSFPYVAWTVQPLPHAAELKTVESNISDRSQVTENVAPAGMVTRSFGIPYIFSLIVGVRMVVLSTVVVVAVKVVFTQSGWIVRMSWLLVFLKVAVIQSGAPGGFGEVSRLKISLYFTAQTRGS